MVILQNNVILGNEKNILKNVQPFPILSHLIHRNV